MDLMSILRQAGFTGNGLKMAYAIAMAESSGNASAHNTNASTGDNSYGLFQINMLGGMGPERRRQYGLSSNDDLFDPLTNARVAYKMSGGGAHWGPWSTYNSGAYQQYYGGSGADITNTSSDGGFQTTQPKLSDKELAASYGFTSDFLNANPELKKLFKNAVSGGWTPAKFQAELQGTTWWKTHSQTEKDYLTKKYTDPATAKQELDQAKIKMRQMGNQLGIVESAFTRKKMDQAAYNMVAKGWDESQARYFLGQYVYFAGDKHQGQGGEVWDELHQYAYSMGVTMSGDWYADKSRNVVRGIATSQDYKSELQKKAKAMFPQYSKQIEGGQTVADIASPYMQSMAQILELPGGSVNLFNPTIKKALQGSKDPGGKISTTPLWQFENDLRNDPRWRKTQNAQNSIMQVAHQVLSDFGLKF